MTQKITPVATPRNVKEWYSELNQRKKLEYKKNVMEMCGISDSSFYNYLKNKPQQLIAEKMAQIANRSISEMWPSRE